eukprot:gene4338-4757_t
MLVNARSVMVKNFLGVKGELRGSSSLEVFAQDRSGSFQKILHSTVAGSGNGSFPSWMVSGLTATDQLALCLEALVIKVLVTSSSTTTATTAASPVCAEEVAFPLNFLCFDLGNLVGISERQFNLLFPRLPIPPFFRVHAEEVQPTPLVPSSSSLRKQLLDNVNNKCIAREATTSKQLRLLALDEARARLAQEVEWCKGITQGLERERKVLQSTTDLIQERVDLYQTINKKNDEIRLTIANRKKRLCKLKFILEARQMKLLADLCFVYPIEVGATGCSIRGLELPHDLSLAKDEEQVASALGHVVHVVFMASKYLEVPLRYQLLFLGSRSLIRDPVLPTTQDNTFPLFRKGTEKDRFDRALAWLRTDVDQLLCSRGAAYDPSKPLLQNLKTLFHCDQCATLAI